MDEDQLLAAFFAAWNERTGDGLDPWGPSKERARVVAYLLAPQGGLDRAVRAIDGFLFRALKEDSYEFRNKTPKYVVPPVFQQYGDKNVAILDRPDFDRVLSYIHSRPRMSAAYSPYAREPLSDAERESGIETGKRFFELLRAGKDFSEVADALEDENVPF